MRLDSEARSRPPLLHPGETATEGLVDDGLERPTRAVDLLVDELRHVRIQREGGPHGRHHDASLNGRQDERSPDSPTSCALATDAGIGAGDDAAPPVEGHAGPQSGARLPTRAASRARTSSAARQPLDGAIGSFATPISRRTISTAA